jgi:chromosome partitioning protein
VQEQPAHLLVDATDRPHLSIIRSNQKTKQAVNVLNQNIAAGDVDRWQLARTFINICAPFKFVVIDTPASGILQEVALQAADTVVIPVSLDYLGMDGLSNTLATIAKLERSDLRTIILPTMQQNTGDSRVNYELLNENYAACIAMPVPHSVAVRESVALGKTVWEYEDRRSYTLRRVCAAYESLAGMILDKVQP